MLAVALFISVPAAANRALIESVRQAETAAGDHPDQLYLALRALGHDQLDQADYTAALGTFRRMQHLVHRTDGVYSPLQRESVVSIIDAYRGLGDIPQIEIQQHFLFDVASRAYPVDAPQMHEARIRLANWYRQSARHGKAIILYDEVLDRVMPNNDNLGLMVGLHKAKALSLHVSGRCCASDSLKNARDLIESHTDFDLQERRRITLEHADALLLERRTADARVAYATAFNEDEVLDAAWLGMRRAQDVVTAIRKTTLPYNARAEVRTLPRSTSGWQFSNSNEPPLPSAIGQPVPICSSTVEDALVGANRERLASFYLDIDISLDATGRPSQISLEGNTPIRLNRYLRAVLQESTYRPRFAANDFSEQSKLSFRQTFVADDTPDISNGPEGWNQVLTQQVCERYDLGLDTNLALAAD
ncbi:MAG: hypothetical protein ACFHX7_08725 [Pseudomonadota bacterium]